MFGNFRFTAYGACLLVALIASFCLLLFEAKYKRIDCTYILQLYPLLLLGGFLGARLFFVFCSWEQFENNFNQIWAIWNGGFALYGAVLIDLLIVWLYAKAKHITFLGKLYDVLAAPAALLIAIGRFGDYFSQTSFGDLIVPNKNIPLFYVYIDRLEEWHIGLFVIESIGCLLICITLLIATHRKKIHRHGDVMLWFLAMYGGLRCVIESMRQDSLFFGFVRIAQILSAVFLLMVTGIFFYRAFRAGDRRIRKIVTVLLIAIIALLGIAFWAEFTMGQGLEMVNRSVLGAGIFGILICDYWIYRKTPKQARRKRKKRRKKLKQSEL